MKRFLLLIAFYLVLFTSYAQMGIGTTAPNPSAMLDVVDNARGLLAPRMTTTERNAITSPADGLLVYDTDFHSFWYYKNGIWTDFGSGGGLWTRTGTNTWLTNTGDNVGIGTTVPLQKLDVTGNGLFSGNLGIFGGSVNPNYGMNIGNIQPNQRGINITIPNPSGSWPNIAAGISTSMTSLGNATSPVGIYNETAQATGFSGNLLGVYNKFASGSTGIVSGIYNELGLVQGGNIFGMYSVISSDGTGGIAYGLRNSITISGGEARAYGNYNYLAVSGGDDPLYAPKIYGTYNDIRTTGDVYQQLAFGNYTKMLSYDNDTAFGNYVTSVTASGAGAKIGSYYKVRGSNAFSIFIHPASANSYFGSNVGIGITAPTHALHINSTNPLRLEGLQNNANDLDVLVSTPTGVIQKRAMESLALTTSWSLSGNSLTGVEILGSRNAVPLVIHTNSLERMRITASGNVGIGTTNPDSPLYVYTSDNSSSHRIASYVNAIYFGSFPSGNAKIGSVVTSNFTPIGNQTGYNDGFRSYAYLSGSYNLTDQRAVVAAGVHTGSGTLGNNVGLEAFTNNTFTGTITNNVGILVSRFNQGSGTINTSYGIKINSHSTVNGPLIDNYGLYIEPQLYATGKNYSLFAAGASSVNVMEGSLGIATTNPSNKLHIYSTANPLRLEGLQTNSTDNDVLVTTSTGVIQKRAFSALFASSYWSTTGNAGMVSGTNFIGTTDNQALDFRTNNNLRARLGTSGQLELMTGKYAVYLGEGVGVGTGLLNIFIGYHAGAANTTGQQNTALGASALASNTNGYENVAIGAYSIMAGSTCIGNTAVGTSSLSSVTANYNTAVGYGSAVSMLEGARNTAVGSYSMTSNTDGIYNVAIGNNAMANNTTGDRNTAVGNGTMGTLVTGLYNTCVGSSVDVDDAARQNTVSIGGNSCLALGGNSRVRIGNASMTSIGGQVGWTTISDGRFKENIAENVPGLAFVMKLRPVTYNFNLQKENDFMGFKPEDEYSKKEVIENSKIIYTGFIAQEVETAARDLNFNFSGVSVPESSKDYYTLRYSEFVVPIVKAIQEQQKVISDQQERIQQLEKRLEEVQAVIEKLGR